MIDSRKGTDQTKEVDRPEDWEIFWRASEEVELNYHLEVEKCQGLSGELTQLKIQVQNLEMLLQKEKEPRQRAQLEIFTLQRQHEKMSAWVKQIQKENEKIKSVYPIHDLWTAKQLEIDRLRTSLDALPKSHPDLPVILALIQAHEVQRDELKWLLEDAERRFEEQSKRIDRFEVELEAEWASGACADRVTVASPSKKTQVPEF